MTERLRIALVHSFYSSRSPSGENQVVEAQLAALGRAGHCVELFAARTDDLEGDRLYPVRAAMRVATGRGANPLAAISAFGPDVVHVHNLFPNFGRTWLEDVPAPIVHTLHNFRPLCINALLLRDGSVCTLCPDGRRWAGVRHRCYRGSRLASAPLAWANRRGAAADPLLQQSARVIVLSRRQRALLEAAGVERSKLVEGSNFLPAGLRAGGGAGGHGRGWLFVGRLSEEKGIVRLLEHWPVGQQLTVVGDGPQRAEVEQLAEGRSVRVTGTLSRDEVLTQMGSATGLVFPSLWFEAAPLVYLEALAMGLPVVAFEPSAVAEAVVRDGTGAVGTWDATALAASLEEVRGDRDEIGATCRAVFEARHTEAAFCRWASELYGSLVTLPSS